MLGESGPSALPAILDSPKSRQRYRSSDQDSGSNEILAQLSALMPAGAHSAAYA